MKRGHFTPLDLSGISIGPVIYAPVCSTDCPRPDLAVRLWNRSIIEIREAKRLIEGYFLEDFKFYRYRYCQKVKKTVEMCKFAFITSAISSSRNWQFL